MTSDEMRILKNALDCLLENRQLQPEEEPGELAPLQDRILALSGMMQELAEFALQLSSGNVQAEAPPRGNYLAASLKQLQAQLLHLTWQAQCVASGDYMQHIDFMGDFSSAFNTMVEQLRLRETSLREQRDVMERIFGLIEPVIVVSDRNPSEVLYINDMAAVRFGAHVGLNARYGDLLTRILGLPTSTIERQILDEDNERWYGVTARALRWDQRNGARLFYCRDITSQKQRENNINNAAKTDELTGINNRRAFDQAFGKLWYTCMSAHKPMSVLIFDLDSFTVYNDTYGHQSGDRMITQFAHILSHSIGRGDDVIARYGGEKFIVALPFTNDDNAIRMAKSIGDRTAARALVVDREPEGSIETTITTSAGVSTVVPIHSIQPSQLIQAADRALVQAKEAGRNRVCYLSIQETLSPSEP